MDVARPSPAPRPGWPWAYLLLFAILGVAFTLPPIIGTIRHGQPRKDYRLWYAVGQQVRAGEPLYPDNPQAEFPYMYPPTLAVFVFAPLSHLGPAGFVTVLAVVNAACWLAALMICARLATGRIDCHPLVYLVPAGFTGPYVWDTFLLGQVNLVLLTLVTGATLALRHGRPWLAGAALGAAIAAKVFPLPVIVYFAARRKWAAVTLILTLGLARWKERGAEAIAGTAPPRARGEARQAA